ncbi:aspartate-semialdehyde dehydrogenase AsdB [Thermacetogenium phaeum DSM 12270]|uniref:Aspartate-semialdehyde dehydrogenase n=1 Tax=Thermacetogenium phaeum (strain ATCC BAA-254 / DSM 26808 / PB) TaxID=1089553 RepID=K4LH31_THEPS|nr:aspartate-semialdehyde dehydrogenase [Thermacetogenium phaeum]AFV11367.1 aspartate-semialdehyde dehydrogenase AsdB [Thermacetogenium phaeum DSM 12270]
MSGGFRVAIVGATGAVGQEIMKILLERKFPIADLKLLASARSEGKKLKFGDEELTVSEAKPSSFSGVEIAFFAGGAVSKELVPEAVARGAVAIDNSSTFRLEPEVPLVVPEVNPEDLEKHRGIISNPNCSTIIFVVALKPLHDAARVKRAVVTTMQAVSGAGKEAIDELLVQTRQVLAGESAVPRVFPHQIAFNLIPHIDVFFENGYSREEMKLLLETRKILHDEEIRITATTVRVPVLRSHSESVNIETERKLTSEEARVILKEAPGIVVQDDVDNCQYPMPLFTSDRDEVYVGRIRDDISHEKALNFWIVADQLRKGAATNAVQIAEALSKRNLL